MPKFQLLTACAGLSITAIPPSIHPSIHACSRQADRQADRQAGRQTDTLWRNTCFPRHILGSQASQSSQRGTVHGSGFHMSIDIQDWGANPFLRLLQAVTTARTRWNATTSFRAHLLGLGGARPILLLAQEAARLSTWPARGRGL